MQSLEAKSKELRNYQEINRHLKEQVSHILHITTQRMYTFYLKWTKMSNNVVTIESLPEIFTVLDQLSEKPYALILLFL